MRFHFAIRDLLWLTTLVALTAGWWADRTALKNQLAEQAKQVQRLEMIIDLQQANLPPPRLRSK
jgi:hypothetical protein